jgi:hypothetical protein
MAFNDDSTRLAYADHRIAEATRWMAENGFACGPDAKRKAAIEAYNSLAQLEGAEKWLMHRLVHVDDFNAYVASHRPETKAA